MTKLINRIKTAFDEPKEWFAWILAVAASAFLVAGSIGQHVWIAAVAMSVLLLGWIQLVEVGNIRIGDKDG